VMREFGFTTDQVVRAAEALLIGHARPQEANVP
jgi:hypothetical protein